MYNISYYIYNNSYIYYIWAQTQQRNIHSPTDKSDHCRSSNLPSQSQARVIKIIEHVQYY